MTFPDLPNDLHVAIPRSGIIPTVVHFMHDRAPKADPVVALGTLIPFLLYELNSRGFNVEGLTNGGPRDYAPLSIACLTIAPSGSGKSSTLGLYEAMRREAVQHPHEGKVSIEGTTAGVISALQGLYDPAANATTAFLVADEFSSVLGAVKKSPYSATLPQFFNTTLKGDTYSRSLRGAAQQPGSPTPGPQPGTQVVNPRLSGVFYTVKAALDTGLFSDDMASTGFLGRLLVLMDEGEAEGLVPLRKRFKTLPMSRWDACVEMYKRWLNWLDVQVGQQRTHVSISEDAYVTFDGAIETLSEEFDKCSTAMRSWLQRAEHKAHIIGGLYALSRGSLTIEDQDAEAAVNLLFESRKALHKLVGHGLGDEGLNEYERKQRDRRERLVEALKEAGAEGLKRSQCYRSPKGWVATNGRSFDEIVEPLLESGEVLAVPIMPRGVRYYWHEHKPKVIEGGKAKRKGGRPRLVVPDPDPVVETPTPDEEGDAQNK